MAEGYRGMKTEHAGAKNGDRTITRNEAKQASKKRRRQRQFKEIQNAGREEKSD